MSFLNESQLAEKWSPVINHGDLPEITEDYRKKVVAVLLENTERALSGKPEAQMPNGKSSAH